MNCSCRWKRFINYYVVCKCFLVVICTVCCLTYLLKGKSIHLVYQKWRKIWARAHKNPKKKRKYWKFSGLFHSTNLCFATPKIVCMYWKRVIQMQASNSFFDVDFLWFVRCCACVLIIFLKCFGIFLNIGSSSEREWVSALPLTTKWAFGFAATAHVTSFFAVADALFSCYLFCVRELYIFFSLWKWLFSSSAVTQAAWFLYSSHL